MSIRMGKPITREVSFRFLGYPERAYIVEFSVAGVRMRRKGTRTWYGPASFEQILNAAARVSARDLETQKEIQRAHA